jgi:hypothetical protein
MTGRHGLRSATPAPSASGARLLGDDLQHLIGWYWALCTMRPESAIESVALESLGAGNLDDVVVLRRPPERSEYWQVKATVAASDPVSSTWLLRRSKSKQSLLERFYATYLRLKAEDRPLRLVLATNRSLDPHDPVLACRESDDRIANRLRRQREGSPGAAGRKAWADHLGVSEEDLCSFLDVLYFHTDASETTWRERVADVCIGLRLQHDAKATLAGLGKVREWVRGSRIARDKDDVTAAIRDLKLGSARPQGVLVVHALDDECEDADATDVLDWRASFAGDTADRRRGLRDPEQWNSLLLPELEAAADRIRRGHRDVLVRGSARLPVWFAVGSVLRETKGMTVSTDYQGELWGSRVKPRKAGPEFVVADPRRLGDGPDFAVVVSLSTDITPEVLAYLSGCVEVGASYTLTPATGPGARTIGSPRDAMGAALWIRGTVRELARQHPSGRAHLFLAAPSGLALLLGHLWDRMPLTQTYESLAQERYERAFLIE